MRRSLAKADQARIDYAELRDPEDLSPVPDVLERPTLLALAVFFDPPQGCDGTTVRLIDNRVLNPQRHMEDSP